MRDSSAVGKKTVVGFGALAAAFALTLPVRGAVTNLYDAVAGAGLSLSATSTLISGQGGGSSKLVNGVTWIADNTGSERVIFTTPTATLNPSVTITVPDEFEAGKRIVLRRVNLYPVSYWGNAKNRMPTAYRVLGIDELGRETELASVSGLTYPNLGENAAKGECYGLDIPESAIAAARVGWRRFKVEFLDSPSWTSSLSVSLMEVALSVEILPVDPVANDLYRVQNFSKMIREGGYPINWGGTYDYTLGTNGWSQAANAFDGYTYHLDVTRYGDNFRWLGYMCRPGGFFAALRAPAAFRDGDVFIPVACRLWSLSYNSNERARGPTEFRLSGVADPYDDAVWKVADETTCWTEIEHKSGLDWSNVPYSTKGYNTLGLWMLPVQSEGYRAFRFRPLNSNCYNPQVNQIDAGLSEVEIFVQPVNRKGTLRVRADHAGCDFGDGHPADWALVTAETVVTAPEYVKSAQLGYRVKGYRLEAFDYTTLQWVVGDLVEARSYAYVPDAAVSARLVWELEESGCKVDATLMDGGNEKPVTYDPAPEGEPYFALGTTLTLTAHPNADVLESAAGATNLFRSAFVRWEGDTNGLADVTSPTIPSLSTVRASCTPSIAATGSSTCMTRRTRAVRAPNGG